MSSYKDILIFCTSDICRTIISAAELHGLRFITAESDLDFARRLSEEPDAAIISYDRAHEGVLESFRSAGMHIPVAIVADPEKPEYITALLKEGFTSFLPVNDLQGSLNKFLEPVLFTGKKPDVLIKTLNRLKNLAGKVSEGIIIMDDYRKVGYVNSAAERILGIDKTDLIGKGIDDIFLAHPFEAHKRHEEHLFIEDYEFETVRGKKLHMDITCSANYENGEFAGAVLIFSKISVSVMDRQKELELLKYQQRYHSTQQSMAFKKQMLILKDEVSNVLAGDFVVETYFKPLDVLSGDIYGSINIHDGRYLFYIIDAMGKGLSASVTALQSSSFINHSLELSLVKNDFDMNRTLTSFLHYIRDRLMDEEALCVVFALYDSPEQTLTIANYGMPPVYMAKNDGTVSMIRANNLPVMRCIAERNFSQYSLKDVDKFMIMSDGLIETTTTEQGLYADHLKEHLSKAVTKKHFLSMVNKEINSNEDDITFFFIRKNTMDDSNSICYSAKTTLDDITKLSSMVTDRMRGDGISESDIGTIEYAMSEILMNALEHGNIGLGFEEKQELIASGDYDKYLKDSTSAPSSVKEKIITVSYQYVPKHNDCDGYVEISIQDEGMGFAPASLFKYHSFDGNLCHVDTKTYNGRGIFITDTLMDGLFYNEKGNCAYIVKLIQD